MELLAEYAVFICYSEETGKDWAEAIRRVLISRGYSVYVAHLFRHLLLGDYQKAHDRFIEKCKVFILINTLEALDRDEVIREVALAFPNGNTTRHAFWIVRHDRYELPYSTPKFREHTGIDLSKQNQAPFKNESELNSTIISRCRDDKRPFKETSMHEAVPTSPNVVTLTIKVQAPKLASVDRAVLKEIDKAVADKSYQKALNLTEAIVRQIPLPPMEWIYNKAWLLSNLGRNNEALEIANMLAAEHPGNTDVATLKALVLHNLGIYKEAISIYDRLLQSNPDDARSLANKASALENLGDKQQSMFLLEKATSLDPTLPNAWYNLGVLYAALGREIDALRAYDKATELDQEQAKAYVNKGAILRKFGRIREAIECYDKAIKLIPSHPLPYHNKGLALSFMQEYRRALTWFNESINRDHRYYEAWMNRGVTFANLGNMTKAHRDLRKASEIRPDDPLVQYNVGGVFISMKRYKDAEIALRKALALNPNYVMALSNLGYVLHHLERNDESIEVLSRALALKPNDAEILVTRSAVFLDTRRLDDAINDCKKAIELKPSLAAAHYNIAIAYAFKNQDDEVLEHLGIAFANDPTIREDAKKELAFKRPKLWEKVNRLTEPHS